MRCLTICNSSESIIRWVKKKTGPAAVTVDTPEALAALEKESAVIAVGYFAAFEVRAGTTVRACGC